ncbi:methyl-accepting chemotaxis protein [Neptuniibacter halophilus]|uniref:methyl-accepting chemotaxis protein n=1 Tax=Neptuniibacter halophilus TaxID=651666 RepID=UPI002574765D|nr:methyl-accepting chemotaxis protein [Neptuniibacter halophilus]
MSIRALPISVKLLSTIIIAFVLLVGILSSSLYLSLGKMESDILAQTQEEMESEILGRLNAEAGRLSSFISGYVDSVYRVPLTVSRILAATAAKPDVRLSRDQVNELVRASLSQHQDISSTYAQFEANGYDGADNYNRGSQSIHTVADSGALEIYWVRNSPSELEQQRVEDSQEKYADEVGEFGIREAEWYLCAKDKKAPCILDPYLYEISPGNSELMTSLTAPVMVEGTFSGLVGIDVNLPIFQNLTERVSKELYGGRSKVSLLSDKGLIVSSSHYREKLTRPLTEARNDLPAGILKLHQQANGIELFEGTYYVAYPVKIAAADTTWSLLIELPQEVVLESANRLSATIDQQVLTILSSQIIQILVVSAAAIFLLLLLIRSVVSPIRELDRRVMNLSSAEGDLTQVLTIDTHAELISLSNGFNQFMHKLRDMVTQLKNVGEGAKQCALKGREINDLSLNATTDQQREIQSVVVATNELSATSSEVSKLAAEVAGNAQRARQSVENAQKTLSASVDEVGQLTAEMGQANESIQEVANRTDEIYRILEVIQGIAEQTNLLALNAAIEAARAGDKGRGFAVVADEVRNLASKTQDSTEEINTMIQGLKSGVTQAVATIEQGTQRANGTREETLQSYDLLATVGSEIGEIAEHITQVATAAEQQSSVSEEISRNLTVIGDATEALAELAGQSNQASTELENEILTLDQQLSSLRT